jgi:hypothetical protein
LSAFEKGTFGQITARTGNNGNPVATKYLNKPQEEQISTYRRGSICDDHGSQEAKLLQRLIRRTRLSSEQS